MARHEDFPDFDPRNLLGDYMALEDFRAARVPPCARSGKLVYG
jgi:hypothetical protein